MIDMQRKTPLLLSLFLLMLAPGLFALELSDRYALVLQDEPAAKQVDRSGRRNSPQVAAARQNIRQKQAALREQLEQRGFKVTGHTDTLLNAVFVIAKPGEVATLRAMSGVKYVSRLHRIKPSLDQAVKLIDAPNAWNVLGGTGNAGAGQKIAIIDTGIDQTHPAFQDSTLQTPSGYPMCDITANCAFTNSKVIVARSYVAQLAANSGVSDSFPDDYSPRDRVGHGTAVAMCAGGNTNAGPLATITGLAPHAFLGNYKVFGSPGVNDGTFGDILIMALDDAFNDGMDIANFSNGGPGFNGPLDTGSACGLPAGQACDAEAQAIETAIANNMVVVVAVGNDGQSDPTMQATLGTVDSPSYAQDAIAVGASENSRYFSEALHLAGPAVPSSLQTVEAVSGDGPFPNGTVLAPLIDASKVGDAYGCSAYGAGAFNGSIALIERGPGVGTGCAFLDKVNNAQTAGAVGVVLYDNQSESLLSPNGLTSTSIPTFFISNTNGILVKTYVDSTAGVTAGLDPSGFANTDPNVNQITQFSSRGPSIGTFSIKPDVVAPGEFIYMATQNNDPNGVMYDPSGYTSQAGTSFSTPMVSGIAALVRQKNPSLTATQVKSVIVNTATSDTSDPYILGGVNPSSVLSAGAGKVEALNAISTTVTAVPSTISFGALQSGFSPNAQAFVLTNAGTSTVTLALSVNRVKADSATQLTLDNSSVTLTAGQTATVHLTLSGSTPAPGEYEGAVNISGVTPPLHIPYLYLVGNGIPASIYPLAGDQDQGFPGQVNYTGGAFFKVVDQYGVPVAGAPVAWTALDGGSITTPDTSTDQFGIAGAGTVMGTTPNTYTFRAALTGTSLSYVFTDTAVGQPTIATGGVVDAANNVLGSGIAPGSYVSIYGTNLSNSTQPQNASYVPLPISMNFISVAFDASGVSAPGALSYVGTQQINVQVPWELEGQSSVQIKVNNEPLNGALVTVPVTSFSPGLFLIGGLPAAEDLSGVVINASHPATRGQYITLYCNGLGPVSNQPATGAAALASPLSSTPSLPVVTIGGQSATVQFSGLAPGFVGLYQINVQVPAGIGTGNQPIALSMNGVAAPGVNIPVQ